MDNKLWIYVGTYTLSILFGTGETLQSKGHGIDLLEFDSHTGKIEYLSTTEGVENPSYLVFSHSKKYLFAVNELKTFNGDATGTVSAFKINQNTGQLEFINRQKTGGADPCHVNINQDDTFLFVSNYMSGSICVLPVAENGSLLAPCQIIQHEGSSINPRRQTGPHAHSLVFDKDNSFAFVPDLGIDQMKVYKTNFEGGQDVLTACNPLQVFPGSGPRHCEFNTDFHHCYLINELGSSISLFYYDGHGNFELVQTVSTLAKPFSGDNICADIHLTPDGKYLYGSNRGHNSIVTYLVDPSSGKLSYLTSTDCGGKTPRNFAVDPGGRYLIAANQDSDNIVSLAIDSRSGALTEVMRLESPTPVCIKFFEPL